MKEVIFTKDFATKKKGDKGIYDNALASTLIRELKVAKLSTGKKVKK